MTTNKNREVVTTPELREGDIVWTHGMRVELSNRTEHRNYGSSFPTVHFDGRVLNMADVDVNVVPVSFRTDERKDKFVAGEYWAIQGNQLATWTREVSA